MIKSILMMLMLLTLGACGKPPAEPQTATLSIAGMTCQNCVDGITGSLNVLPGVTDCQVNLTASNAVVQFDAAQISPEQLAKRVNSLGFTASVAP